MSLNEKDILRIATAGNLHDGKSTLIGRLLYDSVTASQLQNDAGAVKKSSGISIQPKTLEIAKEEQADSDVAYQYFESSKRKFILADVQGELEYTRNMITGASSADAAIILVDCMKEISEETKRHVMISSILDVNHLCICINKMDLCDYSEERFNDLRNQLVDLIGSDAGTIHYLPTSGLNGDNIVSHSPKTPWYTGKTVIEFLNSVPRKETGKEELRLQVQHTQGGYSFCKVLSGDISNSQKILQGPLRQAEITELLIYGNNLSSAAKGDQITIRTDIDLSPGEILAPINSSILKSNKFCATICWLSDTVSQTQKLIIRQGTFSSNVIELKPLRFIFPSKAVTLNSNGIAECEIVVESLLSFDPYKKNKETGSFFLIDPETKHTVAAGFLNCES